MKTKWLILGLLAVALLFGGGAYCLLMPTAVRAAYDRLNVGMTENDVERVVHSLDEGLCPNFRMVQLDWEGRVADGVRSVHLDEEDPMKDKVLSECLCVVAGDRYDSETVGEREVFRERGSKKLVGSYRQWHGEIDICCVFLDADGRVVEKAYVRYQDFTPRKVRLWGLIADHWPF